MYCRPIQNNKTKHFSLNEGNNKKINWTTIIDTQNTFTENNKMGKRNTIIIMYRDK